MTTPKETMTELKRGNGLSKIRTKETMRKLFPLIATGLFFLDACASFQRAPGVVNVEKPSWIDGSSIEYPSGLYLTGVGSSDSHNSAGNAARAEISKIISSRVTVNENVSEAEGTKTLNGQSKNTFSQSVSQAIEVASQKVLRGVKIAFYWENPVTKNYYAFAVMDRQQAGQALTDKISVLDGEMRQWDGSLGSASDKFARARAAMKISALIKARSHLASELQVISVLGQIPPAPIDEARSKVQIANALSALAVSVSISGENASLIETGIVQGLNGLGIPADSSSLIGAPDILIKGQVENSRLDHLPPPWKWGRAVVMVSLEDAHDGKIFSQFDLSDREASSISRAEAVDRADSSLGNKISTKIRNAISVYFEDL